MKKIIKIIQVVWLVVCLLTVIKSTVSAAENPKVEIWSYSLGERIEHRSIKIGENNDNFGIKLTPMSMSCSKVTWKMDDIATAIVSGDNKIATVYGIKEGMTTLRLKVLTEAGELSDSSVISVYTAIDNVLGEVNASGCDFYRGATRNSWIRSKNVQKGQGLNIIGSCGNYYYVELPEEYNFDDNRLARKAYVEKSKVYVPITEVMLSRKTVDLRVGESTSVQGEIVPSIASHKSISYSMPSKTMATVSDGGIVKGLKEGYVKIEAKAEDKTASCGLSIYSQFDKIAGKVKEDTQFWLGASENEAVRSDVSSGQEISIIGSCGNYFRVQMANDYKFDDGDDSRIAYILKDKVYVPVTGIRLNKTETILGESDTEDLKAEVLPQQATNKEIKWLVNKRGVVEIEQNGKIKVLGTGNVRAIAKSPEGPSASCKISVLKGLETSKMGEFSLKLVDTTVGCNTLKYTRCDGATQYEVYRGIRHADGTYKWEFVNGEYGQFCDGDEFEDEVDIGSTYYYKVVAQKKYSTGTFDFVLLDKRETNIIKVCNGKIILSGEKKGKRKIFIHWNEMKRKNEKKQGYLIYKKKDKSKKYKKMAEVNINRNSYTDKSVKKHSGYTYLVRMFFVNSDGNKEYSPYSNKVRVKIK